MAVAGSGGLTTKPGYAALPARPTRSRLHTHPRQRPSGSAASRITAAAYAWLFSRPDHDAECAPELRIRLLRSVAVHMCFVSRFALWKRG